MLISIHQPEHLPWPGFFNKIKLVDLFVILDDVKYRKGYFHNRNKIIDNLGNEQWITIPVIHLHNEELINKKKIKLDDYKKLQIYKDKIFNIYKYTDYFKLYEKEFFSIYEKNYEYLVDLNLHLISFFLDKLEIKTKLIRSSEITCEGKKSNLILSICKKLKASEYLSGKSGKDYLDLKSFERENIKVDFHQFKYPQFKKNFKYPNLSTLDMLFKLGPDAKKFII
jgi:hypothetical protein